MAEAPVLGLDGSGRDDDVAQIHRIVADVETGFNTNDAALITAHFARDASAVNVMGTRVRGLDELRANAEAGLRGPLRDEHARYEVDDIVFLQPDVALAHKSAWATDSAGRDIDVGHSMVALYVLVRRAGRWWIAARQNTLVPAPPPAPLEA
jgi:uncharacterized protein (TIGR02246 family)